MASPTQLPARGAWRPGDGPGKRQFFTFATDRRGALDSGAVGLDTKWSGGDYYDAEPAEVRTEGLAIARMVAHRSDMLSSTYQQRQIHDILRSNAVDCDVAEIDSPHRHDALLITSDQLAEPLGRMLAQASKTDA